MHRNGLTMSFSFKLRLFRAFFGRKNECQKLPKSKANPLQKSLKMAIFSPFFFRPKNVWKWLNMHGNGLKCRFRLIYGFLGHFLVEKMSIKNMPKSKANPLQRSLKMAIFSQFVFRPKNV